MDLIINGTAALRTSLGVRRLYLGITEHLNWPGTVSVTQSGATGALERLGELIQRGRKDSIFWSPTHRGPLNAFNHVVSVHDCINIEFTYARDWRLPYFRKLFQVVLDRAIAIAALSNATRAAILRNYAIDEEKIVVIPAGHNIETQKVTAPEGNDDRPSRPFVLMVSNALAHKNTVAACRAYARSRANREGVALRVVGSVADEAAGLCREAGVALEECKNVDDATLLTLYRTCRFLFSPSLDEGYNLPIAEALAAGTKVLCSDIPVHREFYDGWAMFCDPLDEDSMAAAIDIALGSEDGVQVGNSRWQVRTFRDMAAEYRTLFDRVAAGLPVRALAGR